MPILNATGEAVVHGQEVGEEASLTMLFCVRIGRELVILFDGHQSA